MLFLLDWNNLNISLNMFFVPIFELTFDFSPSHMFVRLRNKVGATRRDMRAKPLMRLRMCYGVYEMVDRCSHF